MSWARCQTLTLHSAPGEASLSPVLRRACDRCRRRKTRCDGRDGCRACVKAGVECLYLAVPKPLGRRPRKQKGGGSDGGSSKASPGRKEDVVLDETPVAISDMGDSLDCPTLDSWSPSLDLNTTDLPYDTLLDSLTPSSDIPSFSPPTDWTVPPSTFTPYIALFFTRLYPVFPILDHATVLLSQDSPSWPEYTLLAALATAVSVQLNLCLTPAHTPEFWMGQTLRARQQFDITAAAPADDEVAIVTSFFLFKYYGNRNRSARAWYHLREAIGFALGAGLDDTWRYEGLEEKAAQRRCRLFWLLYVTERAYALQQKATAMLRPSIPLPRLAGADDPKLIHGFVCLVTLFQSVDDRFLSVWKGASTVSTLCLPGKVRETAEEDARTGEMVEVQRLDVGVTRKWLHLLAWQIQTRGPGGTLLIDMSVPFAVSRETLRVITMGDRPSLECHGIGMEQKMFDIACCLADVLRCSTSLDPDAVSAGYGYLHGFMTVLASFRNRESEYLQPLLARASTTLAAELGVPALLGLEWDENGDSQEIVDLYRSCSA